MLFRTQWPPMRSRESPRSAGLFSPGPKTLRRWLLCSFITAIKVAIDCMDSRAWLLVHSFSCMDSRSCRSIYFCSHQLRARQLSVTPSASRGIASRNRESNSAVKSGNPAWANTGFASGQTSPVKSGTLQRIRGNAGLHDHAYAHTMFSDRLEPMPDEPMPDELNQTQRRASRTPGFVVKPGLRFCLRFWRSG